VGADNAVTSCDLRILVDEAAEPVVSSEADGVVRGCHGDLAVGRLLAEGPVRPVGAVVISVLAEGLVKMSLAGDEDAVGALAPGAGDPPLADRVRPRRVNGCGDDPHAGRGEDRVERIGVPGISVPDRELQAVGALAGIRERVPGLLRGPGGGGVGGDAGQVRTATLMLDDGQYVEPAQEHGIDVEEIDCGDRLGPGRQELRRQPRVGLSRAISRAGRRIVALVRGRPGARCWQAQRCFTRSACQRRSVRGATIRVSWRRCTAASGRVRAARKARPAHVSRGDLT
jgi:hypothetical protein